MKPKLLQAAIAASAVFVFAGEAFPAMDDASANAAMTKAGCNACHALDKKLIGPSFQEIAKKYKGDAKAVTLLSEKVRKGGTGNWGQIPMPPNPPEKISDTDLKSVVEWILTK
jgi:cytochrome c